MVGGSGVLSRTDEGNFEAGGVYKCECARTTAFELSLSGGWSPGFGSWLYPLAGYVLFPLGSTS